MLNSHHANQHRFTLHGRELRDAFRLDSNHWFSKDGLLIFAQSWLHSWRMSRYIRTMRVQHPTEKQIRLFDEMLYHVLLDHFSWPANWFIITVAANIIPFVNPNFSRTTLGYELPKLAGTILTSCLFATLMMIVIDFRNRPNSATASKIKQFLFPLEFVLLPVVGFFLSTVPAIISHTQLMFGKRIEYKVTEKV